MIDPNESDLMRRSGCDDPPDDVPYEPMSARELTDLSIEVGRRLTESEAQAYRRRKLIEHEVEAMLEGV
jgi:hypothetical protein